MVVERGLNLKLCHDNWSSGLQVLPVGASYSCWIIFGIFLKILLRKGLYQVISNQEHNEQLIWAPFIFFGKGFCQQPGTSGGAHTLWLPAAPSLCLVPATARQLQGEQPAHASSNLVARPLQVDMTTRARGEAAWQPGEAVARAWPLVFRELRLTS